MDIKLSPVQMILRKYGQISTNITTRNVLEGQTYLLLSFSWLDYTFTGGWVAGGWLDSATIKLISAQPS